MDLPVKMPNPWEGSPVFVVERTRSTMDDAREHALRGHPVGTAVIAGYQESGRGRVQGRRWISAPWESLLFSVVIAKGDPGFPPGQLPLRAAAAVCRAMDGMVEKPVRIKWPNDIIIDGRKLAGILCENRRGILVCGIGINCMQISFSEEISRGACSLRQAGWKGGSVFDVCTAVLRELKRALCGGEWKAELDARLEGRGSTVTVRAPGSERSVTGKIVGIDDEGSLLLETEGGTARITQGEIS